METPVPFALRTNRPAEPDAAAPGADELLALLPVPPEEREDSPANRSADGAGRGSRLAYLDWMRGLAGAVMLQGHAFHSFTAAELRDGSSAYQLSQFVGGMPPAVFLFLTGVTLAFLMDSSDRKGLGGWAKVVAVLRRAGYLLGLAYLLRLQLWLFAWPHSPWTDLFKVDILNCMGLGVAMLCLMSLFTTLERVRLSAVLGLVIAVAGPVVSSLPWSNTPGMLRTYVAPDYNAFSFFPWAAFLAFGVSAGSVIRLLRRENLERAFQWFALGGVCLILGAQYFANLPYSLYSRSDFWLDSPALTFIKLGVILVVLAVSYLWTQHLAGNGWSWIRVIGTHSLLIYWVHIELVYGRWVWWWKESLSIPQTVLAAAGVTGLMVALGTIKDRWSEIRAWMPAPFAAVPEARGE